MAADRAGKVKMTTIRTDMVKGGVVWFKTKMRTQMKLMARGGQSLDLRRRRRKIGMVTMATCECAACYSSYCYGQLALQNQVSEEEER